MRKTKKSLPHEPDKWYNHVDYYFGNTYICPICNKPFVFDINTAYIAAGGYVCSKNCFNEHEKHLQETNSEMYSLKKKKI